MRPNSVAYDRYRWKKMDHQPSSTERSKGGSSGAGPDSGQASVSADQKIPVLTTSGSGTPTATTTAAESKTSTPGSPGSNATAGNRRGTKRKNSGNAAARKRRKMVQAQLKAGLDPGPGDQLPQTKNTVAVLNELKRNLVYNLESQSGPVHAPLFSMSVVVDGQKFIGHGRSKKLARIEAAAAALRSFIQFKDGATLTPIKPLHNVDFTSDDPMIDNSMFPLTDPPAIVDSAETPAAAAPATATTPATKPTEEPTLKKETHQSRPRERQNGANHHHNNNLNNNNNNVHSANNKLKSSAAHAARKVSPGQSTKPQPEKGPVMLLHELFTDAHFECVSTDGLQHSKFTVVVTVDGQRFEGTGPSKKMAKNAAAKAALASMCNISFSPLQQAKFGMVSNAGSGGMGPGSMSGLGMNGDAMSLHDQTKVELPQTFADTIGKLVIERFNEVMKGNDVYSRRKVLAGIVMTHGYDAKTAKVISLATGTKCVSGEHMSVTGSVINDSHAEIIARRGLVDFIYTQLDLHCKKQSENIKPAATAASQCNGKSSAADQTPDNALPTEPSIFVKPEGASLYRLRDGINFHLYINTAPCGDARVFSPHENDNMEVDKHPNRKARGQLRTKVESGEGTIPVKSSEGIQTWDGVLQGQRLLTMSCSDKISRWNVLGLQGSLLASVIEPIYLHSIVLGSLLHPAHMYRAICGRVESCIQGLPPPYRLNKPRLALMTSAESRNQTKPPNFSINWVIGCTEVEIVNSFTGKLINNNTNTNKMSRLSKQSFYRRYAAVIAALPGAPFREVKASYFETKMCVPEYQQAKKELFAAFRKEDLGDWLKKPIEQDQFTLIAPRPEELVVPNGTAKNGPNGTAPVSNGAGVNVGTSTSSVPQQQSNNGGNGGGGK
ncbi:double-stranded RNA-specific editase Adar isoform X2 [Uranotaenia lowii]|uniref:double-stranded RNA-specific editase Adar isoform X2 n=1 Tax=Uranotaenia lowii TaxID=190385 RepID=UPI00247A5330|nr:double-stranded RNA-specific editase Adar isoform X2 [Uranotaenia lowii]